MYNASTAFLPSSFSMHFVTLGWSFALEPVNASPDRTFRATLCFAIAAVIGWPFSILIALPFIFEEILLIGHAPGWQFQWRFGRILKSAPACALILAVVVGIDSFFYGRFVLAPLNIINYNIFSSAGPDLFGSEPWYFYILNGALNFNLLLPLALLSLPLVLVTNFVNPKKLAIAKPGQTRTSVLLLVRLSPFYLWFVVLTLQAHKEERFLFPANALLCFQAALSLGLIRGWLEEVYVKITKAPFNAARTRIISPITGIVLVLTSFLSVARILAISIFFRAPMPLLFHLQYHELPMVAIQSYPSHYPKLNLTNYSQAEERMDISILNQKNLTLCYGKEWYRFPSSFLVPEVVRTEYINSRFNGILPKHFTERRDRVQESKSSYRGRLQIASDSPAGFNDRNIKELDRYASPL
ncbi:MAG: mannosyltransferase [Cyphobasidiales sp. Tagirdzhanova-0007]|nr:MAG: mannosyltransferase [Cyphobasidiales sp. Tagirdzhanova-0007]